MGGALSLNAPILTVTGANAGMRCVMSTGDLVAFGISSGGLVHAMCLPEGTGVEIGIIPNHLLLDVNPARAMITSRTPWTVTTMIIAQVVLLLSQYVV